MNLLDMSLPEMSLPDNNLLDTNLIDTNLLDMITVIAKWDFCTKVVKIKMAPDRFSNVTIVNCNLLNWI